MPSWFGPLVVLCVTVVSVVLGRDVLRSQRLVSALRADQMARALRLRRPWLLFRDHATLAQATAAALSGDSPRAESLLDEIPENSPVSISDPAAIPQLRALVLIEAGQYASARDLLGDSPVGGALRRLRAGAAMECGEDLLAHTLLEPGGESGYDEAMRLRLLGALEARRGRWAEGSSYLNQALSILAGVDGREYPGLVVDKAWVHHYLAEGALRAGDLAHAGLEAERATTLMERHGGHPQGRTTTAALAARTEARSGDLAAALRHLEAARRAARRVHGDPLRAELLTAEAEVAWAEGRAEEARASLTAARAIREALGEVPARDQADALLAEWASA